MWKLYDHDHNDLISKTDCANIIKQYLKEHEKVESFDYTFFEQIFKDCDEDSNGVANPEEITAMLRAYIRGPPKDHESGSDSSHLSTDSDF